MMMAANDYEGSCMLRLNHAHRTRITTLINMTMTDDDRRRMHDTVRRIVEFAQK
jgi:hypothetical protein